MSAWLVGGASRRLVGRMRALRKNRGAERSELRNCQPRSQAQRLKQEEGRTGKKRGRLEGNRLGKKRAGERLPVTFTGRQLPAAMRTERNKTVKAKNYK